MPESPSRSLGPTGWAVYLGCSWTWCIGMFLPALLIRDLGFWGYVVFAVPNVVGAAAMGWVLKSPESSRRLVEDHRQAAVLFSRVTILFHFFWLGWLWTRLNGYDEDKILPIFILALFFVAGSLTATSNDRRTQSIALVTWLVSAGLLVALAVKLNPTDSFTIELAQQPVSWDALWLLPASLFGFTFCPYLDLTFHHARQSNESPGKSRVAFGMGFGVFFFSMILLTFLYTGPVVAFIAGEPVELRASWLVWYLAIHMVLQLAFTVSIHSKQLRNQSGVNLAPKLSGLGVVCLFTLLAGGVCSWIDLNSWTADMSLGEIGYRAFLTFYGLVFPTYVYLNVWNIRGRCLRTRTQRSTLVTIIAIVLASPFFFMGFFVRDERYIPAGVAILLAAKLFTGSEDRPRPIAQPV